MKDCIYTITSNLILLALIVLLSLYGSSIKKNVPDAKIWCGKNNTTNS